MRFEMLRKGEGSTTAIPFASFGNVSIRINPLFKIKLKEEGKLSIRIGRQSDDTTSIGQIHTANIPK
jgi:hypothetical protein